MKGRIWDQWGFPALVAGIAILSMLADAEAQAGDPKRFLDETQATAKSGWDYLRTATAFVVGGGTAVASGRAMLKGDWQHAGIAVGLGIGVILLMDALGGYFGFTG